jgi:hypothetical protein
LDGFGTKKEKPIDCTITSEMSQDLYSISGTYSCKTTPEWEDGLGEPLDLNLCLNKTGVHNLIKLVKDTGEFFVTSIPTP